MKKKKNITKVMSENDQKTDHKWALIMILIIYAYIKF